MEAVKSNTSPLQNRQRDYWFDNAKAILIITVVIGHLTTGDFSTSQDWVVALKKFIFVFHMPVFMIISGRFAKRRVDTNDWPTVFSKILVPYLVQQTGLLLLYSVLPLYRNDIESFSFFYPLMGMWYMFVLAIYGFISPHLVKYKWLFPASMLLALAIGFLPYTVYGGFHRAITYYPFFLFGYYTADYKFDFCKKPYFRVISIAAFLVTGVYVFLKAKEISYNTLCLNATYIYISKKFGTTELIVFLETALRYLIGFLFFFFTMGITPTKKVPFSYIGTNSAYVYSLHIIVIVLLRAIDARYDILRILTNDFLLALYCLSGIPIAFLLASKPIRKLTQFYVAPSFDLKKIVWQLAVSGRPKKKD
ncbi:MAG: acyltransferase family protein [Oscillospiraceae bacterium]|nr:acyltransferase family protein [Oscillospiraceae bacterium]